MKDILNVKKTQTKNIPPDISKQKNHQQEHLSNIQPDISKQKKHLNNIHSDNYSQTNMYLSI